MIWLIPLALLSGVFGRMGGAGKHGSWYDPVLNTKWRDVGCSMIVIISAVLCFGWVSSFWYVYAISFLLTWGTFSTYWDRVFGYDNLFFSGLMVGLAAFPLAFVYPDIFNILVVRMVLLGVAWHLLNTKLPQKIIIWKWSWNRDVAEEFLRYLVSL